MSKFENKVAIVTGGGSGIGGATARRLASEGAKVIIGDINEETSHQNVSTIISDGGIAKAFIANIGVSSELKNLIEFAIDTWGQLDILVNNAYSPPARGNAVEISEEDWDESFSILLKAHYLGTKFAVPHMINSGGGNIVNIASVHGALAAPKALIYDTAKAAVIQMTKELSTEWSSRGVRVNAILPAQVWNENLRSRVKDKPELEQTFKDGLPIGRLGNPEEVKGLAIFLASEASTFITGAIIPMDGGNLAMNSGGSYSGSSRIYG